MFNEALMFAAMLQDWQASTELKIREQQRLELAGPSLQARLAVAGAGEASQDTEDDTVSSMEYEEYSPGPGPEQRQQAPELETNLREY